MPDKIIVHKLNEKGVEVWRYEGEMLESTSTSVTLEAYFDREDVEFYELGLKNGDRFVETFHTDHWYNTFAIFDSEDDRFKGWYCNITRPAQIKNGHVYAEDLALDIIVYPDRSWLILDEDEFAELALPQEDRDRALHAIDVLIEYARNKKGPFRSPRPN
jgi:predicted RNA-binding protein associated with RNAse of E/G family